MSEKRLKLGFQRKTAAEQIREIHAYSLENKQDLDFSENLLARVDNLDVIYEDFKKVHNSIISLLATDEEFAAEDEIRKQVDLLYFGVKASASKVILAQTRHNMQINTPPTAVARLPKINIPIFDGNLKAWPAFYDLFCSMIHNNSSLSSIEKFHFLRTSLEKDAFNLIKSIPVSENNYLIAHDTLVKRFQNTRFLATNYFNEIYTAQSLTRSSAKDLRNLADIFRENLEALKLLKFNVDGWDFIIFNILLQKLDAKTRTDFELKYSHMDMPTYKDLVSFLEGHCKALESVYNMAPSSSKNKPGAQRSTTEQHPRFSRQSSAFLTADPCQNTLSGNSTDKSLSNFPKANCLLCSALHGLHRCPAFLSKSSNERLSFARRHKLCTNCLRSPHSVRNCRSTITCRICSNPHHTLLHLNKTNEQTSTSGRLKETSSSNSETLTSSDAASEVQLNNPVVNGTQQPSVLNASTSTLCVASTVLLSTAQVEIRDAYGGFQRVRVLLDTASMANFISEPCVNRLGLARTNCSQSLEGLNGMSSATSKGMANCFIKPVTNKNPTFCFDAVILPKLCSTQPKVNIHIDEWKHIKGLSLADPKFNIPGPIDILLGAELVPYILGPGRVFGIPGQPVGLETVFGWVLQGKIQAKTPLYTSLLSCHTSLDFSLDTTIQKFWELESVPKASSLSEEDLQCEAFFKTTTSRTESGSFIVGLPFRHSSPLLGDSYSQALRRFTLLENKLAKDEDLFKRYSSFVKEYIDRNYISEVPISHYREPSAYYIPHHSVTTGKFRVVWDASAKTSNGLSLNDNLMSGPKLHHEVSEILLKFRSYPVAFICDIKQMYCQILVRSEDRQYQRMLWRFSRSENLKEYQMNRVTFGIKSAPYLALRTLKELASGEQQSFPLASEVLRQNMYVDDCCSSAPDVPTALKIQRELISLLKRGGFELGKWASNHPELLTAVSSTDTKMSLDFQCEGPTIIKVLGLQWDPSNDVFSYAFTPVESHCTKRSILSQIARIFDPLGFLAPVCLSAKHMLQQLWISNAGWDEVPSAAIVEEWNIFKSELPNLSDIKLKRLLFSGNSSRLELHGFCDASSIGYGCIIYIREISSSGQISVTVVSAKSKVAPLKTQSLPRLELCAAVLLADLMNFVQETYSKNWVVDRVYAWSDSQVTLAWISASPHRWKTFIANRVSHIQSSIPPSSWRYIPTQLNPADCASRGLSPNQLLCHALWWQGPDFLFEKEDSWPQQPMLIEQTSTEIFKEEQKTSLHTSFDKHFISELLSRVSSLPKILRIVAFVLRFISNAKRKNSQEGVVTPLEIFRARQAIILQLQKEHFSDIITNINSNSLLPKPFRKLAPFIDEAGILRVGGRLRKSGLPFDVKHPILLPKNSRFTDLVIEFTHREHFHPGLKTLHNILVQTFWILSPRAAIYRCLSKCIKCFRLKPKSYAPVMADLPSFRVSQLKAFSKVCLDYAGPFLITLGKHRGAKTSKAYICLFVCCATKALHLELCSDLSSDCFLAAFRRFISRRGRVSDLYSDQGTNFIGASSQLHSFAKTTAEKLSINWHFNPPAAPHFNGLSEAGVKAVKTHIYRVTDSQILTYEEFYTLLTQIENILNSRPLCILSDDPNDLSPLTPSHFLTLEPTSSFSEPDYKDLKINRLDRWQLIQRMQADFWTRWSQEYLHTLQQRSKWLESQENIKLNVLVLIKNESKSSLKWPLGRVVKLHPGNDGVVRVATVRTQQGLFQRPVVKLCPLPAS